MFIIFRLSTSCFVSLPFLLKCDVNVPYDTIINSPHLCPYLFFYGLKYLEVTLYLLISEQDAIKEAKELAKQ